MARNIEIRMLPIWLDHGDNRACYLIEQVNVDKYLNGKTFRKTVDNVPYEIRFEKEHIIIREDKPVFCEFSLKISKGKKHQKGMMHKGVKVLREISEEIRKTVIEQQKERTEWLSQDSLLFSL
ncbi:hypothetical protein [Veillonella sp. 3310]|uniref:hypothetical protein n=1 Tax=Veillonella sp. 3310 TaxID=2490956 RepID=UPI000FD62BF0|nr:hypothetical protein [Veillonella sp. 3310]DAS19453.1 MAG TPA: hypothetical protein [Caudoviricetes sp.]